MWQRLLALSILCCASYFFIKPPTNVSNLSEQNADQNVLHKRSALISPKEELYCFHTDRQHEYFKHVTRTVVMVCFSFRHPCDAGISNLSR